MNYPLPQDLPGSRWAEMCLRLEPLLGDVAAALGAGWHQRVEVLFTEADLAVAEAVLRQPKFTADWFVIRYARSALHLDGNSEGLSCAPSWPESLAVVLGACENSRCLPSRVEYEEDRHTLRLFFQEEALITVEPLAVSYVSPQARQRAMSTICGLRKRDDVHAELLKRVSRWPGMGALVHADARATHEMQEFRGRMGHHPIPQEWLLSAKWLCMACGNTHPSTATIQAVAAAALGAQSWNHLAAPHGDRSARLLQPWYVCKDDAPFSFHADAIDAFADLLAKAPHWTADWSGVELKSHYRFGAHDYMPTYTFTERAQGTSGRTYEERFVAVYPVTLADTPSDELVERTAAVAAGGSAAIGSLFCVGVPADSRARILDERSQQILIVQEGQWRFTRTGDPTQQGTRLWAYRSGSDGNCVESAAVPTYKGLLQCHSESGTYVLCADYDGAHPVAVIEGLSPKTVAKVRANLPDTGARNMEFQEEERRPRDREDFRSLLKKALARMSALSSSSRLNLS